MHLLLWFVPFFAGTGALACVRELSWRTEAWRGRWKRCTESGVGARLWLRRESEEEALGPGPKLVTTPVFSKK